MPSEILCLSGSMHWGIELGRVLWSGMFLNFHSSFLYVYGYILVDMDTHIYVYRAKGLGEKEEIGSYKARGGVCDGSDIC